MIAFKHSKTIDEWANLAPILREVILWADHHWPTGTLVITRIHDPRSYKEARAAGESGIHTTVPHRAADARTKDMSVASGNSLAELINTHFDYGDRKHKVAIHHKSKEGVYHMHLQVSASTRKKI